MDPACAAVADLHGFNRGRIPELNTPLRGKVGEKLLEEAASARPQTAGSSYPLSLPMGLEWLTDITRVVPLKEALAGPEKLLIERALAHHGGRRDHAAQDLGINRSTLFNKMRKYGLLDVNFADRGA